MRHSYIFIIVSKVAIFKCAKAAGISKVALLAKGINLNATIEIGPELSGPFFSSAHCKHRTQASQANCKVYEGPPGRLYEHELENGDGALDSVGNFLPEGPD